MGEQYHRDYEQQPDYDDDYDQKPGPQWQIQQHLCSPHSKPSGSNQAVVHAPLGICICEVVLVLLYVVFHHSKQGGSKQAVELAP